MKAWISTYAYVSAVPQVTTRAAGDGKTGIEIRPAGSAGDHYIVFDREAAAVIRDRLVEILGEKNGA